MKLKEFKKLIDKTIKYAGKTNPNIYFYFMGKDLDIENIEQFSILPDVHICFQKAGQNEKG